MGTISHNIEMIKKNLPSTVKLVAVSKYKPIENILEAYNIGQRAFGENRPQELQMKALALPKDIEWHFIGHLQSNKIKMVVPYAYLIHSVDTEKLFYEIVKYCKKEGCHSEILLEMHIAKEETKQGFSREELISLLDSINNTEGDILSQITIRGLMSMASFVNDESVIRGEFENLMETFHIIEAKNYPFLDNFNQLSYGMSNDYKIAAEMGSNIVRIGTSIFGPRDYNLQ